MARYIVFFFSLGFIPYLQPSLLSMQQVQFVEMWWCPSCGLAYPSTQKVCLNKNCPLFRKTKSSK